MTKLLAEEAAVIKAPPAKVYGIIADYRHSHPDILPPAFSAVEVLKGGYGAGTEIKVTASLFGSKRMFNMTVAEPEPGHVLTESDLENGLITSFTVDPVAGDRCKVTIGTLWTAQPGLAGKIEALVVPRLLRRVYRQELKLLSKRAVRP